MCRTGGRRCPGHDGPKGRAAHNARRRRNREIKAAIVDEAIRRGEPGDVVEQLRGGSPEQAKEWAKAHDLPSQAHPGHGHTNAVLPPLHPGPDEASTTPPRGGPRVDAEAATAPPRHARARGQRPVPAERPKGEVDLERRRLILAQLEREEALRQQRREEARRAGREDRWWSSAELDSQIAVAEREQGGHRDERNLLGGSVSEAERFGEGTNETSRVVLDNGVAGFHKPFADLNHELAHDFGHTGQSEAQQSIHEVAAWRVASSLGGPWDEMVPPTVLREVKGQMGSLSLERAGKPLGGPQESPEWREAAFFDALIGQQDRHRGNYLRAGDRLTLIDHGYAFGRPGDLLNWTDFVAERSRVVRKGTDPDALRLSGKEIDALDRFLGDENRFGLVGLIEADRLHAMESRAKAMRESGRLLTYPDSPSSTETDAQRKRWGDMKHPQL